LGRAVLAAAPPHHDVTGLTHDELDIGDHHMVMAEVARLEPALVINCAGFTQVDANEADPARAYRDNAQGPQSLALATRAIGAVLIHVSTDYVFDGAKGEPYDETDDPHPLSVYGRSKLAGERLVRAALPEHFIVRTAWLFGGGTDHVSRSLAALRAGKDVGAVTDRTGSPTYVDHLAERLVPLALTGRFGTYHLAGPEPTTWHDLLERLCRVGHLPGAVVPQRAEELGLPAPRPRASALRSVFVENLSLPDFPPLERALEAVLAR
jgi:dTDP-4-dehydrorhamnose reductase